LTRLEEVEVEKEIMNKRVEMMIQKENAAL
jgi:hypothetical protein